MLQPLRDIPIKRKVTLVIMIASIASLLLVLLSLFVLQWLNTRRAIKRDLEAQAEILAANSTGALTFQDQKAATEMLATLQATPRILGASLHLANGELLAQYGKTAVLDRRSAKPPVQGLAFEGPHLLICRQVSLDGKQLGTIQLYLDFHAMESEIIRPFILILVSGLLVALLPAVALSSACQRVISYPILRLALTARAVADHQDYSVRADQSGQDEIGTLTHAFNHMLARIQEQDVALRTAGERYRRQHAALTTLTRGESLYGDSVEAILQHLCEAAARTLDVERVGVWRWNADRSALQCANLYQKTSQHHSIGPDISGQDHPNFVSLLSGTEVLAADDAQSDPRTIEFNDRDLKPLGITSLLDVPINLNGQFIGILRHQHLGPARHWQPDELMFAISMTNLVSIAFGHWERQQTQAQLTVLNRQLIETSRLAGMAEVATGVLHNVGNVLNSINVSATLVRENLSKSEVPSLAKLSALLQQNSANLGHFITHDPKGQRIPGFLGRLAGILGQEHTLLQHELEQLSRNVEHVKEIVAMQQNYARVSGVTERVSITQLVDDALQMNAAGLSRHGVQVLRQFAEVPLVTVDRHKVLQILVNLVHNAKYALDASGRSDRQLTISVGMNGGGRLKVTVTDNGVGIKPENLTRIFSHGFTTRKDGHGFGLHSGANAAKEMGGELKLHSAGEGKGVTATLELPLTPEQRGV